jgi:hypothetical protein
MRPVRGRQRPSARVSAGSYVVDFAQPQGYLARRCSSPTPSWTRTSSPSNWRCAVRAGDRFTDITAPPRVSAAVMVDAQPPAGAVAFGDGTSRDVARGAPRYGYAEPGSVQRATARLLLRDSVRVWHAPKSFSSGGVRTVAPSSSESPRIAMTCTISSPRFATSAGARVYPIASARGRRRDRPEQLSSQSCRHGSPCSAARPSA